MNDSQKIQSFLFDLIETLKRKYQKDIDFILLFGSVVRGEFKVGISDIDLIIQLKRSSTVVKNNSNLTYFENQVTKIFF